MSVWNLWLVYLANLIIGGHSDPAAQCDFMGPGGAYYDLSSLRGTLFSIDDLRGTYTYKISLCSNVDLQAYPFCAKSISSNSKVTTQDLSDVTPPPPSRTLLGLTTDTDAPAASSSLPEGGVVTASLPVDTGVITQTQTRDAPAPEQGPAFQLSVDPTGVPTGCFRLGSLAKTSWSLIDANEPEKGVEVTYAGGEKCSAARDREIRFHFICADGYAKDSPPMFAFETTEYCHYNVTWPTVLACPVYHSAFAWAKFGLKILLVVFILYFLLGCLYYHFQHQREWGWDSMPNASMWAKLIDCTANKITCLSCLRRTGEHGEEEEGAAGAKSTTTDAEDFEKRFPMPKNKDTPSTAPGATSKQKK